MHPFLSVKIFINVNSNNSGTKNKLHMLAFFFYKTICTEVHIFFSDIKYSSGTRVFVM